MPTDYPDSSDQVMKLSNTVASVSFFLLFPGFLFYHQFVAMGLLPAFAAGLFGYVALGSLLVLLALLLCNTDHLKKVAGNRYALWVLTFLLYTTLWTLAHYLAVDADYISIASVQSLKTIVFWSSLFLLGLLLPLESRLLRRLFCISFAVILIYLIYFFVSSDNSMYNAQRIYGQTADVSTYQGFARSVLFTLLLLLAVFTSLRARAVLILGGVFVLFMLMSRSDFYAFLTLSAVLCLIFGIKQPRYFLLLLLVCMEVLLLAAPDIAPRIEVVLETRAPEKTEAQPTMDRLPDKAGSAQTDAPPRLSRQFEVLDFSSSKSWAGRVALQNKAIRQIRENPLAGKFGGHVITVDNEMFAKGHAGTYAHNALSAWVSYGLVGFLIYVLLSLVGFLVAARQVILKQQYAPLWTFAFMLNFICLLLIIVSKPVFWPLPALGWGVLVQSLVNPADIRA